MTNFLASKIRTRRAQRAEYRASIHYAIAHAISEADRNELVTLAAEQGILV